MREGVREAMAQAAAAREQAAAAAALRRRAEAAEAEAAAQREGATRAHEAIAGAVLLVLAQWLLFGKEERYHAALKYTAAAFIAFEYVMLACSACLEPSRPAATYSSLPRPADPRRRPAAGWATLHSLRRACPETVTV